MQPLAMLPPLLACGCRCCSHACRALPHTAAVLDAAYPERHVLLTGSFNWTWSARARNCENVLVTADADAVALYRSEHALA